MKTIAHLLVRLAAGSTWARFNITLILKLTSCRGLDRRSSRAGRVWHVVRTLPTPDLPDPNKQWAIRTQKQPRKRHLDADEEWQRMNVPVSTETKQSRKHSTEAHSSSEENPEVSSLGNMSADDTKNCNTYSIRSSRRDDRNNTNKKYWSSFSIWPESKNLLQLPKALTLRRRVGSNTFDNLCVIHLSKLEMCFQVSTIICYMTEFSKSVLTKINY